MHQTITANLESKGSSNMAARGRKKKKTTKNVRMGFLIEEDQYKKFVQLCDESGVGYSFVLRRYITDTLEQKEAEKKETRQKLIEKLL